MTPTTIIDRFDGEYAFLSNFYDAPVTYNGLTFLNSEAAFQAQKEPERAQEFTKLTPGKAKVLGRHVTMREDWNNVRIEVMRDIVRAKFAQHPELAEKLVETGTATLIEGNYWHDYFWGVCNGKGENHLGKILMDVREEISKNPDKKETYTWDDIYVRADGCAYGDDALTAKDNARWELGCLIEDMMGFDIEDCECPEEEIDKFLNEHSELNIRFDIDGHIVEK